MYAKITVTIKSECFINGKTEQTINVSFILNLRDVLGLDAKNQVHPLGQLFYQR